MNYRTAGVDLDAACDEEILVHGAGDHSGGLHASHRTPTCTPIRASLAGFRRPSYADRWAGQPWRLPSFHKLILWYAHFTMPTDADARGALLAVLPHQAGVFTAAQAREAGYSQQLQSYYVRRGQWERLQRGIFRLAAWPVNDEENLVRWSLWAGPQSVVSHDSAARVHQLGTLQDYEVHLTVRPGFARRIPADAAQPPVVLYRDRLSSNDVETRNGYRLTTPLRTLVDLAADGIDSSQLGLAMRDALRRGLVTRAELRQRMAGPHAGDTLRAATNGVGSALSAMR